MRRLRILWILAVFALLFSAGVPQAFASWQCQGRACGTSPWVCCCESPAYTDPCSEQPCETSHQSDSKAGLSHGRCPCVLTVQASDSTRVRAGAILPVPLFVLAFLPEAPQVIVPVPAEAVVAAIGERGPPLSSVSLSTPGLRAPPAA